MPLLQELVLLSAKPRMALPTEQEALALPTEQEALALVEGIKKIRNYLYHHKLTIYTDHNALR